jgi:hypothetical protein
MDLEQETNNLPEGRKPGGQPGNSNARKKPFTEQMKRFIIQNPEKMEKIIDGLFTEAEEGSLAALNIIMDRVEGKPQQSTDITSSDGTVVNGIMMTFVEPDGNKD